MRFPWVAKAVAFQLLRLCPRSAHELLSLKVTGRGARIVDAYIGQAERHAEHLSKHIDPEREEVVEFGAGRDLFNNLFLATKGFRKQLVVDLEPLVRVHSLNNLLTQPLFKGLCPPFTDGFLGELRALGIDYRAPFDMRATDLPSGSTGALVSTSTLEHIPEHDVRRILAECHRILRVGGVCSFLIDYTDHYSHTDRRIGSYNFLQYSERVWQWLSPPNHFQNRLRHPAFAEMFRTAGFDLLVEEPHRDAEWEQELRPLRIAKEFSGYTAADLSWTSSWFLLQKT
jgi:SAM-dependent methyltransferase